MNHKLNDKQFKILAEKFLFSSIDDVLAGNANNDSIRYYIGQAAFYIFRKKILPKKLRQGLSYALMEISKGKDANKAFLLKKDSRRKNDAGEERSIALHVWRLINIKGWAAKKAIITVSQIYNNKLKSETIKRYYCKYKLQFNKEAKAILRAKNK